MKNASGWLVALARIEGALPFLPPDVAEILAFRSLTRLWRTHLRDFPLEGVGPEHNPGLEAGQLMRTWYGAERHALLAWIMRHGHPPLAAAARRALAARPGTAKRPDPLAAATIALGRLDAALPSSTPLATLAAVVEQLCREEVDFLEGESEMRMVGGRVYSAPAARGAAWGLSLAIAVRPQLFALGAAPLALAGVARRELFRALRERPVQAILDEAIGQAAGWIAEDLARAAAEAERAREVADGLYASSHAARCLRLLAGLAPLSRAELARAMGVTARTASLAVQHLEARGLAELRLGDAMVVLRERRNSFSRLPISREASVELEGFVKG